MADNTRLPVGGAGDDIRTIDRSGVKTPVSLLDVGGAAGPEAFLGDPGVAMQVAGTVTVTGVSTAANQTTIIGHLDGVEGLLTTIDADTGGIATSAASIDSKVTACNTGAVVVSSSALPSGAATSVKQDTQTTHLATLAGAVSGTEVQVDVLTMPTVAVTGTFWQATQPVSIAATVTVSATDMDIRDLTKTADSVASWTNTAKDGSGTAYQPIVDTDGHLQVDVLSGGGGTQYTEGDTDASITGTAVLWEDAADTLVAVSAAKPLPVSQQGAVTVSGTVTANIGTVGTLATAAKQDTGNTSLSSIDGKVTACNTGAVVVSSSALPSGAATAAKQPALGTAGTASADVLTVQGIASMTAIKVDGSAVTQPVSGTFWQATQPVSVATVPSHDVTNAGTFSVQVDGAALTALQLIDNLVLSEDVPHASADAGIQLLAVRKATPANLSGTDGDYEPLQMNTGRLWTWAAVTGGNIAHDAAESANPLVGGGKATTSPAGLTLVADADRTYYHASVDGFQYVRQTALEDIVTGDASNTDGTSTSCIAAQGAGIRTYIQTIVLTNTHATTNTYVQIKDDTTVKMTIPVPANGGAVVNLPVPLRGSANVAWNFDPGAAVTTIYCSMVGFKSKV